MVSQGWQAPPSRWRGWRVPIVLLLLAGVAGYLATWLLVPAPLPGHVIVPTLRGMAQTEAAERLAEIGLRLRIGDELADPTVDLGLVSWQTPVAETQLPKGAAVTIGLSSGIPAVVVPNLEDLDLSLATQVLTAAGLKLGTVDSSVAPHDPGTVVSTLPEAGSALRPGGMVAVTTARTAVEVAVPSVIGLTIREARNRLTAAGLRPGQFSQEHGGKVGTVLGQEPAAGTMVPTASKVNMTISGVNP